MQNFVAARLFQVLDIYITVLFILFQQEKNLKSENYFETCDL